MRCQPSDPKCSHLNLWFVGVPHSFTQPFCFYFSFLQMKCKFWGSCQREARDWCIKCILLSPNLSLFGSSSVSLQKWVPLNWQSVSFLCWNTVPHIKVDERPYWRAGAETARGRVCRIIQNVEASAEPWRSLWRFLELFFFFMDQGSGNILCIYALMDDCHVTKP